MNNSKHDLIQQVITSLRENLEVLRKAAMETHSSSTDAQSKQEGKYDMRKLEASYLAEAQVEKVVQLKGSINKLEQLPTDDLDDASPIAPGAMIIVSNDSDDLNYMMLPAGGGMSLHSQGLNCIVITPDSPIGSALLGKHVGDTVDLQQHESAFISDLW